MKFTAIDIETANPDMSSICQIGLARFENGVLVKEWSSIIDPEDYFYDANISIHGIDEDAVEGQPTIPDVIGFIKEYLENTIAVCHTSFDKNALLFALEKYQIPPIETTWLDSSRVVRRTWIDLSSKGYGLANVCKKIGYEFKHHDALEDAKAASFVLLEASKQSGINVEQWVERVKRPINSVQSADRDSFTRDGNPEGDLYGEVLVFTGSLQVPRRIAADMAASVGCQVADGITKKTTILVVGDLDATKLAGHDKSAKQRKAEELVANGQKIRIVRESDFERMIDSSYSQHNF